MKQILAVAGGGKTTYLVNSIREALEKAPPYRIMAVTYTRNMASELVKKIGTPLPYCGTFHHILYMLIGKKWPERYINIVDELENKDIIQEVLAVNRDIKLTLVDVQRIIMGETHNIKERIFRKAYMRRMQASRSISYPMIEMYGKEVLGETSFDYLYCDEFQDMSADNISVLDTIASDNKIYVMDPMQSIYSFRGAEPENIVLTGEDNAILNKTYRCPEEIVKLANHLLDFNDMCYPVRMTTERTGGVVNILHENVPYEDLVTAVKSLLERYNPKDICILGRTNAILEEAQKFLDGLPIQKVSSNVMNSREMLAFRYFLRIVQYADDENVLKFCVASKMITKENAALIKWIDPTTLEVTSDVRETIDALRKSPLLQNFIESLHHYDIDMVAKNIMESFSYQHELIDACVDVIKWLALYHGAENYYDIERAISEANTADLITSNSINLMTIHTAKGLEYPAVIILNAQDGVIPHFRAKEQEELRLLYVAVTRASKEVWILKPGPQKWLDKYNKNKEEEA